MNDPRLYVREDVGGWRVIFYNDAGAERGLDPNPGPFSTHAAAAAFVEGWAAGFDAGAIYEATAATERGAPMPPEVTTS